jgi:hypothetical protein
MEQSHDFSAQRIDSREIGTFVPIATLTSQRQIGDGAGTSMLNRDDVLDVVREPRAFLGSRKYSQRFSAPRRTLSRVAASIVSCGSI